MGENNRLTEWINKEKELAQPIEWGDRLALENCMKRLAELEDSLEQGELVSIEWHNEQVMHAELVIQEYEQAIESGELVRLPCKVGDHIYYLIQNNAKTKWLIMGGVVLSIEILETQMVFSVGRKWHDVVKRLYLKDFNDNWFTDKAQADAKLKELEGKK